MNFFKTVFSEDLEPPDPHAGEEDSDHSPTSNSEPASGTVWSFGGLIRTLADRSDSVIESYRRDIDELRSGLKKETAVIRTVASRTVSDSLEKGASVAQESLETVGQAIDDIGSSVWKSTAQIISQGREALLVPSDQDESDSSSNQEFGAGSSRNNQRRLYSRFEMQLIAVQNDANTYCSEPEDLSAFEHWLSGFNFEDKREEIEGLLRENPSIREIYEETVPVKVGDEAFWCRYFYKMHKLEEAEAARAKLMQRAISGEQDEELRWDSEEDGVESDESSFNRNADGYEELEKKNSGDDSERWSTKKEESSCKYSDFSVVSSQPSMAGDEDLGWDEIEDVGSSNDETRGEAGGSTSRSDLRKRLSAAEDEDLSWDIEDDVDEPIVR